MPEPRYDQHYRDDPAACGEPFAEFVAFAGDAPVGSVLDLGCGQGRDALLFARAGHRVHGVDLSSVGVAQLLSRAQREGLPVTAEVADLVGYRAAASYDLVMLDRVLQMLDAGDRVAALNAAMAAVAPGGHLLVAEGPKGLAPVRAALEAAGWALVRATKNRLIAKRP